MTNIAAHAFEQWPSPVRAPRPKGERPNRRDHEPPVSAAVPRAHRAPVYAARPKFNRRAASRKARKRLTLTLLWRRHLSTEPPNARSFFIALAACAECEWHVAALVRFAVRRWPLMAGELRGAEGLERLARRYFGKGMSNRRFGKVLGITHVELFAIAEANGTTTPRQWCRESDRTGAQIAAADRLKRKLAARDERARKRCYLADKERRERKTWCARTGKCARTERRHRAKAKVGQWDRPPRRVTVKAIAFEIGISVRSFYNRPEPWQRAARALMNQLVIAERLRGAERLVAHLHVQMSAFRDRRIEETLCPAVDGPPERQPDEAKAGQGGQALTPPPAAKHEAPPLSPPSTFVGPRDRGKPPPLPLRLLLPHRPAPSPTVEGISSAVWRMLSGGYGAPRARTPRIVDDDVPAIPPAWRPVERRTSHA